MAKKVTGRPGLFGTTNHYDANGKKIGSSSPGMFASQVHYDAKGRKTGSTYGSCSSLFGADHYDSRGHKVGDSHSGWLGSTHSEFDD